MAIQDTALRLIKKFGEERQIIFQVPGAVPADPAKPWAVDPTSTEAVKAAPAVVVDIKQSLIDGQDVKQGDQTVLVAALSIPGLVPSVDQKILDEGQEKSILQVTRVAPGQTEILWKLRVRAT